MTGATSTAQSGTLPESLAMSRAARELLTASRPKNQYSRTPAAAAAAMSAQTHQRVGAVARPRRESRSRRGSCAGAATVTSRTCSSSPTL